MSGATRLFPKERLKVKIEGSESEMAESHEEDAWRRGSGDDGLSETVCDDT